MGADLAPLRQELERRAADEVARIEEEAGRSAEKILEEAHSEASRRRDEARRQGESMADAEGERRVLLARREAARGVLAERRAVLDELRRRSLEATKDLRGSSVYSDIEKRLVGEARRLLGTDDCEVERDPAGEGGVRATSGTRMVDLTLGALVERCLAELGGEVEDLWA